MKVLHCIPTIYSESGGPVRALIEMCSSVKMAAPEVDIDIMTTDYVLDQEWLATLTSKLHQDIRLHIFPHQDIFPNKFTLPFFSIHLANWFWHHASEYDVIHIHSLMHPVSNIGAYIARRKSVPYIMSPHGTLSPYIFQYRHSWLKKRYFATLDKKSISGAKFLHFTTDREHSKALRFCLSTPARIIPLPFQSSSKHLTRKSDPSLILFMSRIHPKKGLDCLVYALAQILPKVPNTRLAIAGSSDQSTESYERKIKALTETLNVTDNVDFLGFVEGEDKQRLLEKASIFVLPSYEENFGIAVVEAMASQIPVVITKAVDISPQVEMYQAGIVIGNDINQLANALLELLEDPDRGIQLGQNGHKLMQDLYSPKVVGKLLHQMYLAATES